MELFWSRGYEAASLSELTKKMGIGRQSLYDTFGDKQTLFLEAVRRYVETQQSLALALLRGPEPASERFERFFELWRLQAEDPQRRGCLLANCRAELGDEKAQIAELLHAGFGRLEQALERTVRDGMADGSIPPNRDPLGLARTLVAMANGVALRSRAGGASDAVDAVVKHARLLLFGEP